MKLDIHEIYHQYIIRVVIFSLFLYKRHIRQPNTYRMFVIGYTKKRIPWKINLSIDTGDRLPLEEERDLMLDKILNDIESDYQTTVIVKFTTPLKEITMDIDLKDEEKYQNFLYQ